jgi:DNA-binding CsgD family transcriptional regulator
MIVDEDDYLAHYGVLRRSGRYPWGSSSSENVRNRTFLEVVDGLKLEGYSEVQIAESFDIKTTQLRAAKTIAKNQQKQVQINMAQRLADKGNSNSAIGRRMGLNESSIRALLAPGAADKVAVLTSISDMLKDEVSEKKYLDVGKGVENHLGVSKEKLLAAVAILKEQDYEVHYLTVPQIGTGNETSIKVLVAPGTTYTETSQNRDKLGQIAKFSTDHGRNFYGMQDPLTVNPKRVDVRYGPDGGAQADGVIYIRRGVEELSLGGASYAQVRIKVGDGHYLKGMAMYKDDLPVGTDLLFNTNKTDTGNKLDAMKPLKADKDNPFGAVVRQLGVDNVDGSKKVTSAMNIVNEEGDWNEWSKSLSTQMLSKQKPRLAKEQLAMTYERAADEYASIMALTNPTVRKKLLQEFSDGAEASAVHMKAAALPRQRTQVILPIESLSEREIYAPNFRQGERVVLIRYPHGGTFEIPELTVNNNNRKAKGLLGNAKDAVGINSKVAERMSGADFDGDTVLVIPNGTGTSPGKVKHSPALDQLKGFDPHREYPSYPGMKAITPKEMQSQMGKVSNLITDMTIGLASHTEIARAVRHSMVVIDAEKHNLDYKTSAQHNGIKALKEKYQGGPNAGASTLISRATSELRVDRIKPRPAAEGGPIDRATGKKVFVKTGESYVDKRGKTVTLKTTTTRLLNATDAASLSSGTPIENEYVAHSNKMRALGDKARKDYIEAPNAVYSRSANKAYVSEVKTLDAKLNLALMNAPRERQAQVMANAIVKVKREANPDMEDTQKKRIEAQALFEMRNRTGAKPQRIEITSVEWNAIQAGAITNTNLKAILDNADMDSVRALATPRTEKLMTSAKTARAQSMLNSGYTRAEVADHLGISITTLDTTTEGGE